MTDPIVLTFQKQVIEGDDMIGTFMQSAIRSSYGIRTLMVTMSILVRRIWTTPEQLYHL